MKIVLLILLSYSLLKWWYYRCFCIGLMYHASLNHDWDISDEDAKKIVEYSMKRCVDDLLKKI